MLLWVDTAATGLSIMANGNGMTYQMMQNTEGPHAEIDFLCQLASTLISSEICPEAIVVDDAYSEAFLNDFCKRPESDWSGPDSCQRLRRWRICSICGLVDKTMFKREIINDAAELVAELSRKLEEYILQHPGGMGLFRISPVGEIYVSDGMWSSDIDYHDDVSCMLKMEYPEEAFAKMEEYERLYPELTDEELNADLVWDECGGMVHPYHQRIMDRHFAEMKIREMANVTVRADRVREVCEDAIEFFHRGPAFRKEMHEAWLGDDDQELDGFSQEEWGEAMAKFLSFEDEETLRHIDNYASSDWKTEGLAPDYPVATENFDPENDYCVKDLFYHQDMELLELCEWRRGKISQAIVRQICNDFYFALFMDELDQGGVTDNWWFGFGYSSLYASVFTPDDDYVPVSNRLHGYFRVKDYVKPSGNKLCPERLDLGKMVGLFRQLGL